MKSFTENNQATWTDVFNEIKRSDLPEAEKVAAAFRWLMNRHVEHAEGEIELSRAMNDRTSLVKEQIKLGAMKHTMSVFYDCYKFMLERKAWDE